MGQTLNDENPREREIFRLIGAPRFELGTSSTLGRDVRFRMAKPFPLNHALLSLYSCDAKSA